MIDDNPIDFVITWVDMNDPEWKAEFAKYSNRQDNENNSVTDARFRDYGLLRFWFRGVEKFAPWVRRIHFVTNCNPPQWLATDNKKLHIVNHKDIIPDKFLPTFNSVVIERYIHKIPGLADRFVYFNDDFYIIREISPERFFKNGLPRDIAAFQYNPSWSQWYKRIKNNLRIINRKFDKKEVTAKFPEKWYNSLYGKKARVNYLLKPYGKFITLRTPHNAQPYLKATFNEVWDYAEKELTETSFNRFRKVTDYTPELFRTWQICKGDFEPYNTYVDTKMFPLMLKPKQAIDAIYKQKYSLVCLNDNIHIRNYEKVMEGIKGAFQHILPDKSTFEKR